MLQPPDIVPTSYPKYPSFAMLSKKRDAVNAILTYLQEDPMAKHGLPNPFLEQMQEHVQVVSSLSMREKVKKVLIRHINLIKRQLEHKNHGNY